MSEATHASPAFLATWSTTPILRGVHPSLDRPNPDYHPEMGVIADGTFLTISGAVVEPEDVPAYIREAAEAVLSVKVDTRPVRQEQTMADVILASEAEQKKQTGRKAAPKDGAKTDSK